MCISSGFSGISSIGFFPQPKRLFSDAPGGGGGAESIGHDHSKRPSVGGGGGSKGPAPPVPTSAAATDIKLNDNKVRQTRLLLKGDCIRHDAIYQLRVGRL